MSAQDGLRQRRGRQTREAASDQERTAPVGTSYDGAPAKDASELSFASVLIPLALVRAFSAMYFTVITDCDQTFNYEEPTHYLLYGRGLQTWEYAPQYALRSYAYTGLHAVIGWITGAAWGADKISVFHRIHLVLALFCALAEAYFVTGIARRFSRRLAILTAVGLMASAGMFHAAPSYLPSTFTMCGLLFGWGAWLRGDLASTVASIVFGLVLGWPFAVVAVVPVGLHILFHHKLIKIILHSAWSLGAVCGCCILVDQHYYRKLLLAPWNIILYNAFGIGGGGQGSDLYGVEPASFYAKNLLLNFNALFVVALASPFVMIVSTASGRFTSWMLAILSQLWLWFALMSSRPHKEERFMFGVFPLICLAAAYVVDELQSVSLFSKGFMRKAMHRLTWILYIVAMFISGSRVVALVHGFSAPVETWTALGRYLQAGSTVDIRDVRDVIPGFTGHPALTPYGLPHQVSVDPAITVCVGKEWYRFPSAFFLPEDGQHRTSGKRGIVSFAFVKSAFSGQLPQPYLSVNGTSELRKGFNDVNAEEVDRYVDVGSCDYVVDFRLPVAKDAQDAQYEPYFYAGECGGTSASLYTWSSIYSKPFLHAESSASWSRAFFIPRLSSKTNRYGTYEILEKVPCSS